MSHPSGQREQSFQLYSAESGLFLFFAGCATFYPCVVFRIGNFIQTQKHDNITGKSENTEIPTGVSSSSRIAPSSLCHRVFDGFVSVSDLSDFIRSLLSSDTYFKPSRAALQAPNRRHQRHERQQVLSITGVLFITEILPQYLCFCFHKRS